MGQPQGVPHLMRRDEFDQPTHHFVVELNAAGFGVDGRRLNEIPVVKQFHHVVVPPDVAFQYLARARVVNMRPEGVLYG